jgi:hypothetical protein
MPRENKKVSPNFLPNRSAMRHENDRVVLAAAILGGALILFSLFGWWRWFGAAMFVLMLLLLRAGYGRGTKVLLGSLCALLACYLALLVWIVVADQPAGDLVLMLALPQATALLVYGLWPLGFLVGALYYVRFSHSILPADRLEEFLRRFSRPQ